MCVPADSANFRRWNAADFFLALEFISIKKFVLADSADFRSWNTVDFFSNPYLRLSALKLICVNLREIILARR